MPKKHYAGDVQQAIAAEIAQLRAQQSAAPAQPSPLPARAKQGNFASQPSDERSAFGSLGDVAAPDGAYSQSSPATFSRRGVAPPPPPAEASAPAAAAPPSYAPPAPGAASLPTTNAILTSLDQRINRLEQVRAWIGEDGEMARFLDTVIGQQVKSSERRQARLAVVLNIIFLIAGWALSYFLSPTNITNVLPHL